MPTAGQLREKLASSPSAKLNVLMASLTGPGSSPAFYERAFRKRHNVLTFGPFRGDEFWKTQAQTLKQHAFYREGSAEYWADAMSRLAKPCDLVTARGVVDLRQLKAKLPADFQPDLFVWIEQYDWNLPINLESLDCPKIALFGDTHVHLRHPQKWETWLAYARLYDFVFVSFNRSHAKNFQEAGCSRVFWSPPALDPEVHCKLAADKIYPVSFVGSTYPPFHPDRIRLLKFLIGNQVDIYIDIKVLRDMSLVFSRSKIVLNRSMAADLNMRVFEALGSGSLLVTNRLPPEAGLDGLFRDREHLVLYEEPDLLELIRFYLEHDEARERIASAGHAEALRKHTYEHRVQEILRVVQQHGPG
ncbi:MAG: glycosyltransferase [Verrucomicrobia bacterium]|nr:glycosyltransferase [Verrucomicrobiota bacterium]